MSIHSRHVIIATGIVLILLLIATVAARAQDYSAYSGADLYKRFCASCHGPKGAGDGVVAPSLKVMVPDLTGIAKRHGGAYPEEKILRIIDGRQPIGPHGSRTMPVWGYEFQSQNPASADGAKATSEIVKRIADYVRSMQAQ